MRTLVLLVGSVPAERSDEHATLVKTHLQRVLTSVTINVVWMVAWLQGQPHAKTRRSRFAALAPAKLC